MISDPQLELPILPPRYEDPNIEYLVELLYGMDWVTAAELTQLISARIKENWSERKIRGLAEAASPEIISGQLGYRHIDSATLEEIHHFVQWMESQARKMIRRAEAVRRRAHGRIH
jgi:hypothetical protein